MHPAQLVNICCWLQQTAPPDPKHPSILSRLLDLEYTSNICKLVCIFFYVSGNFISLGVRLGIPPWRQV
ncbi:MAG TPA: hypothetical protein VGO47_08135 [Chlamydiales bacterium]|nr:hypothetical protein [Chlamydiales bacterium]